jgi:predicted GNAT superfamily acetyltransferase
MISWTFDPLIRRNAYFNLCKLAARPRLYIPDFYGEMVDGINTGDRSDRLVVEWPLRATEVAEACAGSAHEFDASGLLAAGAGIALEEDARGRPRRHAVSNRFVLVNPPADIERLRVDDPVIARVWRYDLRHVLLGLLDQGARIIGFSRRDGYILDRAGA